jgi:hypothetical protein
MIYFLRHTETGLIKIGRTVNYSLRLSQLIAQYGDLELVGLMEGYTEQEQYLHGKFCQLKANTLGGREWFVPDDELIDYIENMASMNFPLPFHGESIGDEIPTRQVRLYEDDAKIIDFVLLLTKKSDKRKTFADVVRAALRNYYKDEAARVGKMLGEDDTQSFDHTKRNG